MRKRIACVLTVFFAVALFSASSGASEVEISEKKRELISELFDLMDMKGAVKVVSEVVVETLDRQIRMSLTPALESEDVSEGQKSFLRNVFVPELTKRLSEVVSKIYDENTLLNEVWAPIYDKYFNEEELALLINHYETPIGQKYASVQYGMAKDYATALSVGYQPKVEAVLQQVMQEMFTELEAKMEEYK
ncbi:MAG TPA: DUF2059 domain-containing protein [bacterium]|nr:DUF2059 domain-containing protein [bacterium]